MSLKDTIEQKYIDRIVALSISVQSGNEVLDLLAENGMLDINAKPDGFCLLMFTKQKNKINRLIELGCDINQKVDNTESKNYGKTVYEVALAAKKKGWVDYLKPHLNQALLDNSSNEELVDFQNAKKSSEQLNIYLKSIKQKNYAILNEIIANQIKYKDLI